MAYGIWPTLSIVSLPQFVWATFADPAKVLLDAFSENGWAFCPSIGECQLNSQERLLRMVPQSSTTPAP